jgi:hypothetical protein
MHDRAVRLAGPVKSAAAIAIEITILPNIDLRIAQVRPRVEATVHRTSGAHFRLHFSHDFARKKVIICCES